MTSAKAKVDVKNEGGNSKLPQCTLYLVVGCSNSAFESGGGVLERGGCHKSPDPSLRERLCKTQNSPEDLLEHAIHLSFTWNNRCGENYPDAMNDTRLIIKVEKDCVNVHVIQEHRDTPSPQRESSKASLHVINFLESLLKYRQVLVEIAIKLLEAIKLL